MLNSLISDENKTLIKNILNDTIFPIKVYSILILILFSLNTFYIFRIFKILDLKKLI